jgi:hypothetical protein
MTVTTNRSLLMAKSDWLVLLGSAVLAVIPAPADSGELTKGDHAAFAIKPVGSCGDVKTQLWGGLNVAAVAPDRRLGATSLCRVTAGKSGLSQPYFGLAKQVAARQTLAAPGTEIG